MRRRGAVAVLLGAGALLGAWLFGSVPLVPVGAGLVAAGLLSLGWHALIGGSLLVERRGPTRLVEGDRLELELRARGTRLPAWRVTATQDAGALGVHRVPLRRGRGTIVVEGVPRGVHELGPATLELEDPLGLERAERPAAGTGRVCVWPRVVVIDRLPGGGGRSYGGSGRAVRAVAGLEPHGIRGYQDGEPLRSVHWPSTARRGELMVRELEDPGRDQLVVLLDGDRAGDVGPPGRSSFDEAVRAAAAIVRRLVADGRHVRLVVRGAATRSYVVRSPGADWEAALDGLAAARADAEAPLHAVVAGPGSATGAASETVVVTCRPTAALARQLAGRRGARLVVVDAPTYAEAGASPPGPGLLALASRGVAVAVVRRGDDLAEALSGRARERLGA